jgi:hypothetical protein
MQALKMLNLGVVFLVEGVMFLAYGYWGYHNYNNGVLQIIFGILLPLLVALLWGIFAAPKSTRRLKQPSLIFFKSLLFIGATAALFSADKPALASIFITIALVNQALAIFWHQENVK